MYNIWITQKYVNFAFKSSHYRYKPAPRRVWWITDKQDRNRSCDGTWDRHMLYGQVSTVIAILRHQLQKPADMLFSSHQNKTADRKTDKQFAGLFGGRIPALRAR